MDDATRWKTSALPPGASPSASAEKAARALQEGLNHLDETIENFEVVRSNLGWRDLDPLLKKAHGIVELLHKAGREGIELSNELKRAVRKLR